MQNNELYEQFTTTLRDAWKVQWLKESQLATETLFQLIYYITEHGDDVHLSGLFTWPLVHTIIRAYLQVLGKTINLIHWVYLLIVP